MASNAYEQGSDNGGSEDSDIDIENNNLNDQELQDENDNDNDTKNENEKDDDNRPKKMKFAYRMQIPMKDATDRQKTEHLFFRSILNNDLNEFSQLVTKIDMKQMDSLPWTPLMTAVLKRRSKMVKELVLKGANIRKRDIKKRVVLHVACEKGFAEIVKLLLLSNNNNNNNNTKKIDESDNCVISNNMKEKIENNSEKNKKKKKSYLNTRDNENNTPLHYAAIKGHTHLLGPILFNLKLHKQLCEINEQNIHGQAALHLACEKGHITCVKDILEYKYVKCDLDLKDKKGHTALERSVCKHNHLIVEMLLDHKANVNIVANNGMTCIMVAAQTKDNKMVTMLLNNKYEKPNLWIENKWDRNVFYYLSKYRCDADVYENALKSLKEMLHECLVVHYASLPDSIAQLLTDMTYGVRIGDTLKEEAAKFTSQQTRGVDEKPSQ